MRTITAKIAGKYFDDENTQTGLEDMLRYDQGHIEEYQFDDTDTFSFIASLEKLTYDRWKSFGFSVIDTDDDYWYELRAIYDDTETEQTGFVYDDGVQDWIKE